MEVFRRNRAALAAAVAMLTAVGAFAAGQEPSAAAPSPAPSSVSSGRSATELRLELLRDRWQSSAENRDRAPQLYASLKIGPSYVPADDFLYGLVRFKHNQYEEAEAALDLALERSPDDPMFLKTRVWAALARKRYDQAETALARFQEVLFKEELATSKRTPATRNDDLVFLGQVHGYLVTAAERLTKPEPFEKLRDAIAKGLSLEELRTFEAAERETQDRYDALVTEKEEAVAGLAEAADEAAAEKMTEFDERRRQLQEQRVDIDAKRTEAVNAAEAELRQLVQTQAQAQQAQAVLGSQIVPARNQYSQAMESVERARRSLILIPFNDFSGRQIVLNQMQAAEQQASAIEAQLLIAERNLAQAQSTAVNVSRELTVKESSHRQKVGEIERALRQIEGELKRLDKEEETALGKGAGTTIEIRQMSQKIGALDSYVDYSLETPRLKLIEFLERR